MYNQHFGLTESPFTISPDPRYLFMSARHRDALAHLLYGIGSGGGFVLLTGEVGTGKTTVCRCLLEQLPSNVRLAYILNPKLNAIELMATMCDELGIAYEHTDKSLKTFTDLLSQHLLSNHESGLNTVLMIDEAQNLSVEVLEQIRLLTNLETNQKKLLQIILIGQPELQELLAKKELRQLAQRITARYHLRPLSLEETRSYLEHRLRIAGVSRPIFKKKAIAKIQKSSQGIPRLINVISDRALLGAFAEHKHAVDDAIVQKAVEEVLGSETKMMYGNESSQTTQHSIKPWLKSIVGLGFVAVLGFLGWNYFQDYTAEQVEQARVAERQAIAEQTATIEQKEAPTAEDLITEFWGEQSWDRSGEVAAQNVLAQWGLTFVPYQMGNACEFANDYLLSCDKGHADWELLEKLNRPVALKFRSASGGEFWGAILGVDDTMVRVQFGKREARVKKSMLNPLWTGEYQLFWKRPQGFSNHLAIGDRGVAVVWLTEQIRHISQESMNPSNLYSEQTVAWTKEFQTDHGLLADGIIGIHTVMMINNATQADLPRLITKIDAEAGQGER